MFTGGWYRLAGTTKAFHFFGAPDADFKRRLPHTTYEPYPCREHLHEAHPIALSLCNGYEIPEYADMVALEVVDGNLPPGVKYCKKCMKFYRRHYPQEA